MFDVVMKGQKICAIYDKRYQEKVDITDGTGRFGWLAYTTKSQKLQEQKKPEFLPYEEQFAGFEEEISKNKLYGRKHQTTLLIEEKDGHLVLDLKCESDEVSAAGIFLPFNFMSRKNGSWEQQFTISSPYHTPDRKHYLYFLARPDGNNLVFVVENEVYSCTYILRSSVLFHKNSSTIRKWRKLRHCQHTSGIICKK